MTIHIIQAVPIIWIYEWKNTCQVMALNTQKKRLPVQLVYYEEFENLLDAYERERQIHGWSRRKKECLIEGKFDKLKGLGRR